jgi:hypothetical protein
VKPEAMALLLESGELLAVPHLAEIGLRSAGDGAILLICRIHRTQLPSRVAAMKRWRRFRLSGLASLATRNPTPVRR